MERRIKWLIFFFFLSFSAIVAKLFFWQVFDRKNLLILAENQYYVLQGIPAPRGKIYSSDNFPLVLNKKSYTLFADPSVLSIDPQELTKKIGPILNINEFDLSSLSDKNLRFLPLAKNLTEDIKNEIEKLSIYGLGFEEFEKRFYPEASMSAHLLGFVGVDSKGEETGYFGVEGYYDNEIKGKSGDRSFEQDAIGRPVPLSEESIEKAIPGRDLVLNIDRSVQFLVEKRLTEGIKKYSAVSGLVLVMNPSNGAVISLAASPSYDPNSYYGYDQELYRNPVISSSFEPGSIFKVVVMAAGIDSGLIRPDEICTICYGPKTIGEYTIRTWNDKYYPGSSMEDVIVHSDNIGMVYVAEKMGVDKLYQYLERFGFGKKTNIDLQGEIAPTLRDKNQTTEIDLATESFGQGIAVSPLQVLTAVSSIANKGELYQPQVVSKIIEGSQALTIKPVLAGKTVSPKTAETVKEMMVAAVEKGEAKWAKPKGYKIAGKTGTAQIPIAGHYDPKKTVVSFVGFAPADNPKFVMLVALNEPQSSQWGSETAAPLWFDIAKDLFRLWQIQPEN